MPLYIDVHEIPNGVSVEAVHEAHLKDLSIQDTYGVSYVKYWFSDNGRKIFCLCSAPNAEAADRVHREAHGLRAERIIEIDPELAEGFLGGGIVHQNGMVLVSEDGVLDSGVRTILFTDIVDSTAMTQRLGDIEAMVVLERHDRLVRSALATHHGRWVKHTGDGTMAAFSSAADAVRCASAIQQRLRGAAPVAGHALQIRCGMASGYPVEREGDFFGSTVQLAARLCTQAQPGQTLVSASVADGCPGDEVGFADMGEIDLKGFPKPVRVLAVQA